MNKFFPLLLCLLMACAQKNNNEQSTISSADKLNTTDVDSLSDPEMQTVRDTVGFVQDKSRVINLINKLTKIESPVVVGEYKNDKLDSLWIRIPDEDLKHLIPMDVMGDMQGEVFGIGNLSFNNTFGVLYYIKFSGIDPEDVDEILNKTILVLYDSDHRISDYKVVGIRDYGVGFSKIYNLEKVIYLYTAESENRSISREESLIKNGKFIEKGRNSVEFKSTSQDDEKYNAYIENAFR
ncbi:MAG: hypothetical protein J7604_23435 [Sporocytophaga sp.]|uniref:hypothetical protein n=1 Tax=Sporocytophaga sp. TaxID=2231183 RepID=UPI001B1238AD|nr:hypothetical protein [Sporocytophaga sp.]MBO9703187.1 hypothetical protein [Sporocytophaga sp.]